MSSKLNDLKEENEKLKKGFKIMRDLAIIMWEEAEHRSGRFVVADKLVDKEYKRRRRMR